MLNGSVLIAFILVQYSLCTPDTGDHSSDEDDDISYVQDGWRYDLQAGNTSRRLSTLMNLLATVIKRLGSQQRTPSTDDFNLAVHSSSSPPQGSAQPVPSQSQSIQQEAHRPVQGLNEPYTELSTLRPPSQPSRPQGGWGVQLMDPALNVTQLLG